MLSAAHADGPRRFEQAQIHMGTEFRVVFYAADDALAMTAFTNVFQRIAQLDAALSDYRDDSELSRLSRSAGGPAQPVGDDLLRVLLRSQEVARQTRGAFDVTVGPAVRLWRRARRTRDLPAPERIEGVMGRIGYEKLELDALAKTARLLEPMMLIDLGGIAKGDAVEQALAELRRLGISQAMVVGGGEVGMTGSPPGQTGWRVALNQPGETSTVGDEYLVLSERFVSTSGDASQFLDVGGKRYSHVIDPRTGWALSTRRQVTVVAGDGMTADAWASGLSVLGIESSEPILRDHPELAVRIAEVVGDHWSVWSNSAWEGIAKEHGDSASAE
jgi:thiamine biosynthesis lipoprotein